jgi:hypothetical protein
MQSNPLIIGLLAIFAAILLAAAIPQDAVDQHRRADAVLFPAFVAACNDYASQHPAKDPQHFSRVDRRDRERLELANWRWREFYEGAHR